MRLRHPDGTTVHLAYCTNVHPAEDLDGVLAQLRRYAEPVRAALDAPQLGLGLWLSASVARDLASDPAAVERLRGELCGRGLEVVTLNGFPYGGFHAPRVKLGVYSPDWAERARLAYTLDLARVLTGLLPDDVEHGSISTLPFGWRHPWTGERQAAALGQLVELSEGLAKLAAETGRRVRVGLEPEPGCVVETTSQAVARLTAGGAVPDGIGVCLDACHLAVAFEEPGDALDRLRGAGLDVVKVQASAALHADAPRDPRTRAALAAFVEERFLHQTREQRGDGVVGRDDLPDALGGDDPLRGEGPWRVHFHVPVHAEPAAPLRSTRAELSATLDALLAGGRAGTAHVEVETYTWGVLPDRDRPTDDAGLVAGLAAEVAWVRGRLTAAGLTEETS